jgi:hypothetical protein
MNHIEMYRAARERVRCAMLRGDDTEQHEATVDALWAMMTDEERREVRGVGEIRSANRLAA